MILAILTPLLLSTTPTGAFACSVGELRRSPGPGYRVERVREFIDSADMIVRAVAVRADTAGRIVFAVREWIRGSAVAEGKLALPGRLVPRDDFNPGTVPYGLVRRAGRRGDCYAREYRAGAEYLLLLRSGRGQLTPFWAPLAPLNEQVRGANDPWIKWVRTQANPRRLRRRGA